MVNAGGFPLWLHVKSATDTLQLPAYLRCNLSPTFFVFPDVSVASSVLAHLPPWYSM